MKLKYVFMINELGDEFIGVPLADSQSNFNGVLKFNKETAFIIEQLNNEITYEELCAKISAEFSLSMDEVKINIDEILAKLREAELLEE